MYITIHSVRTTYVYTTILYYYKSDMLGKYPSSPHFRYTLTFNNACGPRVVVSREHTQARISNLLMILFSFMIIGNLIFIWSAACYGSLVIPIQTYPNLTWFKYGIEYFIWLIFCNSELEPLYLLLRENSVEKFSLTHLQHMCFIFETDLLVTFHADTYVTYVSHIHICSNM